MSPLAFVGGERGGEGVFFRGGKGLGLSSSAPFLRSF